MVITTFLPHIMFFSFSLVRVGGHLHPFMRACHVRQRTPGAFLIATSFLGAGLYSLHNFCAWMPVYAFTGMNSRGSRWLISLLISQVGNLVLSHIVIMSLALALSKMFIVLGAYMGMSFIFSGSMVPLSNISVAVRWLGYGSVLWYTVSGMLLTDTAGRGYTCSPGELALVCSSKDGDAVLLQSEIVHPLGLYLLGLLLLMAAPLVIAIVVMQLRLTAHDRSIKIDKSGSSNNDTSSSSNACSGKSSDPTATELTVGEGAPITANVEEVFQGRNSLLIVPASV
jgi:hypothetical protein